MTVKHYDTLRDAARDMKLREFAELADCSLTLVSDFRRSRAELGQRKFARACFRLGFSPSQVYASLVEAYPEEVATDAAA